MPPTGRHPARTSASSSRRTSTRTAPRSRPRDTRLPDLAVAEAHTGRERPSSGTAAAELVGLHGDVDAGRAALQAARPARSALGFRQPRAARGRPLRSRGESVKLKLQLAVALGVLAAGLVAAAPSAAQGPPLGIEFRGQAIVPTGTTFAGTTIGGLSSITYDP